MRSEASIATSVPVPIARPRSAWASAGGVVDAVADHRDHAALGLQAARRRRPCRPGSTSAITSSMPTSAATAAGGRPRCRRSAAPGAGRARAARATASARRGLDGVGDDEDRARRGRPSRRRSRSARAPRRARRAASSSGGRCIAQSASSAGRPTTTRVAVDDALDAEALAVGEALDRQRAGRRSRPRRSPGRSGARRRPRARRPGAAPRRASTPSAIDDVDQRHLAGGHRAGLVEHDRCRRGGWTRAPPGP